MIKRSGKRIVPNKKAKSNKNVYKLIVAIALTLGIKPRELVKNLESKKLRKFVTELTNEMAKDRKSKLTKALNKLGVKIK